ncbi:magnesium and cobalt transport protein CorA [Leekyejoonella antrihumi]|uniref:magnesium and cobalt transport protein CorA n=1 Tax=Leekyejoonella antrihumi TaxID=1660198 RepID=UPI001FE4F698|nr:magnesium and cobalt transport protein CorA [Leekyejoonella antrihumi]
MPTWKNRAPRPTRMMTRHPSAEPDIPPVERSLQSRRPSDEEIRPVESTVVEKALYAHGKRLETPHSLTECIHMLADHKEAMAWVGMYRPTPQQIQDAADVFRLHPLAVEDAIVAHQRPKIERYDDTLFVVLRSAIYNDETETVSFGELHLFVGPDFVLTVRHTDRPHLASVRTRLENDSKLLAMGPESVLYAVLDFVVDGYAPVVAGLENDIEEIETQVFESDPSVSRRIYQLSREVMELQRASRRILQILTALEAGFDKYETDPELQRDLRDVADHATSVTDRVDGFRHTLADILSLNATLVAQTQNEQMQHLAEVSNQQNEQMKKVSSWAAILFAPTVVAGIYGMNFRIMPELHWAFGYPMAIVLMFLVSFTLYRIFRQRGWL